MEHLVLHVGLPKTGSTLAQKALQSSRSKLSRHGYELLVRHEFEDRTRKLHRGWRMGRRPFRAVTNSATAIRDSVAAKRLVVSHEDMLGSLRCFRVDDRPYPEAARVLSEFRRVLAPERLTVVLYLRRQDRFLESIYLQLLRMGSMTETFENFRSRSDVGAFRWDDLVERVRGAVEPGDTVEVRYFESISDLGGRGFCAEFFRATGVGVTPKISFDTSAVNRGYSDVAMRIALAANAHLSRDDRIALRRFLDQNFSNTTHDKPHLLGEDQRAAMLGDLADSNRRLHDMLGGSESEPHPYLP